MKTKLTYEINPNGTATIYQIIKIGNTTKKIKAQTCNTEEEAKACIKRMELLGNQ